MNYKYFNILRDCALRGESTKKIAEKIPYSTKTIRHWIIYCGLYRDWITAYRKTAYLGETGQGRLHAFIREAANRGFKTKIGPRRKDCAVEGFKVSMFRVTPKNGRIKTTGRAEALNVIETDKGKKYFVLPRGYVGQIGINIEENNKPEQWPKINWLRTLRKAYRYDKKIVRAENDDLKKALLKKLLKKAR